MSRSLRAYANGVWLDADLVRAADRALYQAKRDGRNCVRASHAAGLEAVISPEKA